MADTKRQGDATLSMSGSLNVPTATRNDYYENARK